MILDIHVEHISPPSEASRVMEFLKNTDNDYLPKTSLLVFSLNEYSKKIARFADVFFVVHNNNDIAMCAVYMNEKKAFITSLGVRNAFQNRGVASILLNNVFAAAIKKEISTIALEAYEENRNAIRFYEKNNFIRVNKMEKKISYERNIG